GYEVAQALKQDETLRHIPLVAVTAYAMVGDRDKALAAGFDDHVPKPIDPLALDATIRRLLSASASGAADRVQPAQAPSVSAAPPGRPVILVLDDVDMNLHLKRSLLEPSGFEVVTAKRIPEALMLARRLKPALILSDVGL